MCNEDNGVCSGKGECACDGEGDDAHSSSGDGNSACFRHLVYRM